MPTRGPKPDPCPECRSDRVRRSRRQSWSEWFRSLFGYVYYRCQDCGHRYEAAILDDKMFKFAYCPRCHRMDLTSWDPEDYHTSLFTRVKLFFGASAFRCDPCRCNFTSFRQRERRYKRKSSSSSSTDTHKVAAVGSAPGDPLPPNAESH